MKIIREHDRAAAVLRRRLDAFYATVSDYGAFLQPSNVRYFWLRLLPKIRAVVARQGACRILEFGSGRTGFALFLREQGLRERVHLTLHDVVPANAAWLREHGDDVQIGPVPAIHGRYDLILSSFVVEHMTDPQASLEALWRALEPAGSIFLVCPRYDLPLYLPPACDHLAWFHRTALAGRVMLARLRTLVQRKPAFLLLDDAAVFHLPYTKDRDAVHLASRLDLGIFYRKLEARVSRLRFRGIRSWSDLLTPGGLKQWFVVRFLLVGLAAERPWAGGGAAPIGQ